MADLNEFLCWFKRRVIAAGAVAGAVAAIFLSLSYMDQYRWWVWASEFQIVASRIYEATIPEQRRVVSSIERDLERAKSVPPARRNAKDTRRIIDLEGDLAKEQETLKKLYDERARFTPG